MAAIANPAVKIDPSKTSESIEPKPCYRGDHLGHGSGQSRLDVLGAIHPMIAQGE